ncbi:hypothetical protein [Rhizobium sp. BK376]|uniref:hypothetical protein n=1 Tax=Rhizobium sp. BK376 TaxID=2512149 RepID=UPI0010456543|nr:hypothetical protein [Rhizobium sp. BK376]
MADILSTDRISGAACRAAEESHFSQRHLAELQSLIGAATRSTTMAGRGDNAYRDLADEILSLARRGKITASFSKGLKTD